MTAMLKIDHLLVTKGSHVFFDEPFKSGVNIIHGSNGSGKSTITDFIFFGLGGDLTKWKPDAAKAEKVHVQITTPSGTLTLCREVSEKSGQPMSIFFGSIQDALTAPLDAWQTLPYRRTEHGYSFSQVVFESLGMPESISDGASNITMHQLLRLLYVDQLTPVQRLFRVESFDTWQTRQAVGDLLAGVGGYELFDRQIELRDTNKLYDAANSTYKSLVSVATGYGENILLEHIKAAIMGAQQTREQNLTSLKQLVKATETVETADNLKEVRKNALKTLHTKKAEVHRLTSELEVLVYEIDDADSFINHLRHALRDFEAAADTFAALGHLEFEFCPACFSKVKEKTPGHCQLCNEPDASDESGSRTLAVKLDLQMQLRESIAIQQERQDEKRSKSSRLRVAKVELRKTTASTDMASVDGATGRETAVAQLSRKVGFLDSELEGLQKRLEIASRIEAASKAKEELNDRITRLKNDIKRIERDQHKRKLLAYSRISDCAKGLLEQDLEEHSDFGKIDHVGFEFSGDWVAINGEKNRSGSASGMVVLKNSVAAAMLQASFQDPLFNLPRWMMFDNIEDKGMVQERSWNFQRLLIELSNSSNNEHQVIFTTSKIAPELAGSDAVIGRKYTKTTPTLNMLSER
jgi:hypothetical protein